MMTGYDRKFVTACVLFLAVLVITAGSFDGRPKLDKTKCPKVKSYKHFNFEQILGPWYVVEYYASSEESIIYRCMQTLFTLSLDFSMSMNFTYSFIDDPDNEQLYGNITWHVPDMAVPAHWIHAEDTYEGVYNTYVMDIDVNGNKSWVLLLHCAEKTGSTRYLSSFIMGRQPTLPDNVLAFLRDKLPRYNIDLQYMFKMDQTECDKRSTSSPYYYFFKQILASKHPMNHAH